MSDFTFELDNATEKLETYEWDNHWIEHANRDDIDRVLYIGDSISCGARRIATAQAGGKFYFDGLGTSKAVDNPYFEETVSLFARQQRARKLVLFNNGLHGGHLDGPTYAAYYEKLVQFLLKTFGDTPVALVLTTFTKRADEVEKVVTVRNRAVLELAEKYHLPVVDLFAVSKANADTICGDGVHFTEAGYEKLAAELVKRAAELM